MISHPDPRSAYAPRPAQARFPLVQPIPVVTQFPTRDPSPRPSRRHSRLKIEDLESDDSHGQDRPHAHYRSEVISLIGNEMHSAIGGGNTAGRSMALSGCHTRPAGPVRLQNYLPARTLSAIVGRFLPALAEEPLARCLEAEGRGGAAPDINSTTMRLVTNFLTPCSSKSIVVRSTLDSVTTPRPYWACFRY